MGSDKSNLQLKSKWSITVLSKSKNFDIVWDIHFSKFVPIILHSTTYIRLYTKTLIRKRRQNN